MVEYKLLERGDIGDSIGEYFRGLLKGDTRSLDYSSHTFGLIQASERLGRFSPEALAQKP